MQVYVLAQVKNPAESLPWLFKRPPPDNAVNLVSQRDKIFGQMASVLTSDSGD